jgi:hypothetical protein
MKRLMQKAIIEIKKPCTVNLDLMNSDEKGKFCTVCQTSVIDFTNKSPDEIAVYFRTYKNEKICGKFDPHIVKTGNKIDSFVLYLYSKKLKFVAIIITGILFLTGCKTKKHTSSYGTPRFLDEKPQTIESLK